MSATVTGIPLAGPHTDRVVAPGTPHSPSYSDAVGTVSGPLAPAGSGGLSDADVNPGGRRTGRCGRPSSVRHRTSDDPATSAAHTRPVEASNETGIEPATGPDTSVPRYRRDLIY